MPGMRDQFEHFYPLTEDAVASAMTTGLVVPDTNVLFGLYRFQAIARGELFSSLENLGNSGRLWIPYQVGFEYHRNRPGVIADQEQFFGKTESALLKSIGAVRKDVRAFQTRLALSTDDLQGVTDSIEALQKTVLAKVTETKRANEVRQRDRDSDRVLARLERLFDGRVGAPMDPDVLAEARAEAARRGKYRIPPGYMDVDKDEGDPAGDYLIWRQLMTEAKSRGLPVVFITDDVKEDWYRDKENLQLGARPELREEIKREAGVSTFLMMTTETFIGHAQKYLNDKFSQETVDQAKELPFVVRDEKPASDGTSVSELLSIFTSRRPWSYGPTSHFMRSLREKLGDSEMEARVTQAVLEGEASGTLSRDFGQLILGWMNRELAIGEPVNHDLPVDRDAFEAALAVPPDQDNPGEVSGAKKTIEMSMKRQDVTPDDLARGNAWLTRFREYRHIG